MGHISGWAAAGLFSANQAPTGGPGYRIVAEWRGRNVAGMMIPSIPLHRAQWAEELIEVDEKRFLGFKKSLEAGSQLAARSDLGL